MKSYSQLGEDVFVFQNFMNIPRRDVVLFEIGAYDGQTYSNTLALELFHDCKCVLVEPSPINVKEIHANRPKASIHQVAIMPGFGVCDFVGHTPVAGVRSELTDEYIDHWNLGTADAYKVISAPFETITSIEQVQYIDFISIDVQGAEFSVLCSTNWTIPTGVICIELEGQHEQYDEACRGILRAMGFQFKARLHISEFWYNPDYFRANLLFDAERRIPFESFEFLHFHEPFYSELRGYFY
jgi:FkbM family methyltransferase